MSRVINYASTEIRNGQKRPDLSQEEKDPALKSNEFPGQSSLSSSPLNVGEQTPYPGAATDKADVNKYSSCLFGDNLLTDNMDYINSLLKDQFVEAAPPKNAQKRNKRMTREELKSGLRKPTGELISPVKLDSAISPPVNSPALEGNSSLLSPSEPDLKDKIEGLGQADVSGLGESDIKIKGGRNNSDMISTKEVENYENYYQSGMNNAGKRSTSMEDIRISQKNFSKLNVVAPAVGITGGSILSHLENIPGQGAETPNDRLSIPLDRSPQSVYNNDNSNISRAEFASSLNQYIEYFQKSETVQYRSIKASQYFSNPSQRGNTQRSSGQIFTTGTGLTPNNEVENLKNQVKKLKAKVEDLQLMNELLAQERKSVKKREQELLERAENAEGELGNYKKKTKQYRERLRNTEDLLKKEKVDNENNLMALRRVLSNNINNVLEYKINTYMKSGTTKPHHRETNSIFTSPDLHHYDKIKLAKDKEKRKNFSTNPNVFFNGVSRTQGSIGNLTETLGNMKNYSKNNNHMNIKDKISPMLSSNKDQSFSDEEDELKALQKKFGSLMRGEGYYDEHQAEEDFLRLNQKRSSQYSMQPSDDIDSSSEPADETDLSLYGVSKYEANKKVQQIKKLQDQLAKLIEQEESSNDISGYTKSISQRNINVNAGKKHKGHTNSLFENVTIKPNNFLNMISSESKYEQQPKTRNYYKKDA